MTAVNAVNPVATALQAVHHEAMAAHAYFDDVYQMQIVKLLPNEYFVTSDNIMLTTVLGSCVAACVRDPVAGVGGMNHFMLPAAGVGVQGSGMSSMRYGSYAMEVLLNALYAQGARRERLEAKVFGGGMVLTGMIATRVGDANAEFVLDYLRERQIDVKAQDLKDIYPRHVQYFPTTGKARVRRFTRPDKVLEQREEKLMNALEGAAQAAERSSRAAAALRQAGVTGGRV